jgi:hypothetical protein
MSNAPPGAPRIHSTINTAGRDPTSAEACVANVEADKLLAGIKPALVAMILGRPVPFYHVDHVSDAGLLQVVVTRTVVGA